MQSRVDSLIEAGANIFVGFIVSVLVMFLNAWLFNLRTSPSENMVIVGIFTVTSLLRQYLLRRLFNGRSVGQALLDHLRNRPRLTD